MNLNAYVLLVIAVLLLAARLPPYMSRIGMPKADKLAFVVLVFAILVIGWFIMQTLSKFI